ncbi:YeeE/YedE family protein, partial [Vibrio parahaemolyticus]|nr:YeeE/YedE family protein [Vibrio parahaemolyticus]
TSKTIDKKLVGGAALFGIGWGLLGVCPGPAVASLFTGNTQVLLFIVAMAAGSFTAKRVVRQ